MAEDSEKLLDFVKQPYVFCGVCFKEDGAFSLTSCAHIVCDKHTRPDGEACPVCEMAETATIKLDSEEFPKELKSYFGPFLPSLEHIYAIAKFQFERLLELVKHQKAAIGKMTERVAHQKDVMRSVREELVKARTYRTYGNQAKFRSLQRLTD